MVCSTEEVEESKTAEDMWLSFYNNLLADQEELGEEFSKVLYENIWELYGT